MEFRLTPMVVLVLSVCLVHIAAGMPRTVERRDEVVPLDQQSIGAVQLDKTTKPPSPPVSDANVPIHRVPCNFEDVTEDSICQEHCLPKGYSYGVCVSYTCSCI